MNKFELRDDINEEEFFKDNPDDPMHIHLEEFRMLADHDLRQKNAELCAKVWKTGDRVNNALAHSLETGNYDRAKVLRGRMDVVVDYLYKKQSELYAVQRRNNKARA